MRQLKYFWPLLTAFFLLISCQNKANRSVEPIEISFTKEADLAFINGNDTIVNLDIELAESAYEQQTGLMHRPSMELSQGMLFIYEDERPRPSFYMKNTQMALDLIYIDKSKKVVEINKNTKPYDETPIRATQPAQYVLEVNAGFADKYNITTGVKVVFQKIDSQ